MSYGEQESCQLAQCRLLHSRSGQNGYPPRVGLSVVSKDNVVTRAYAWDNGALRHLQEGLVMYVADIIWLPHILDKLVWKHHVSPEEVEEVLFSIK